VVELEGDPLSHPTRYPEHLETVGAARDGTPIALRPIRPENEPLLQDLFVHMSREDQRLRFFVPMRKLSRALAEPLLHLDYDREMALARFMTACPLGYSVDPGPVCAAFAIAVRSD
jgi:acetyltransferase